MVSELPGFADGGRPKSGWRRRPVKPETGEFAHRAPARTTAKRC